MIKYEEEYKKTYTRKHFVTLVLKHYPDITESTALRRFYDMRKKFGVQSTKLRAKPIQKQFIKQVYKKKTQHREKKVKQKQSTTIKQVLPAIEEKEEYNYSEEEHIPIQELSPLKLIIYNDMKKFGYKLTPQFLKQHGFNLSEINYIKTKLEND